MPSGSAPKAVKDISKPSRTPSPVPKGHEQLFAPDPKQKILCQHPKTGKLVLLPKKRPLQSTDPAPVPPNGLSAATSPIRELISPVPQPAPPVPLSPTPSPRSHHSPPSSPPHSEQEQQYDEEQTYDEPEDMPYDPPASPNVCEDYHAPEAPDVSQEELYRYRPSPPDDTIGFAQLLQRAAHDHGVDMHADPVDDDFLMNTIIHTQKASHTTYVTRSY